MIKMSDQYIAQLIRSIQTEIDKEEYEEYSQPCDEDINTLLNNICEELDLTLRFKYVDTDLVKITYKSLDDEIPLFPELIARFREEYYIMIHGPMVCL